jgi:2-oxoglutarate ferredoxin oxidoreductase subunit gamma
MTREHEILITGFGGQGIILTGNIMGTAATIHDGRHATMTQSYGPEARGGSCSSQVVISDEPIMFPYVDRPQVMICMSQEGYTKNVKILADGGLLLWDSDLVATGAHDPGSRTYHIPATRIAEQLGNKMMANIVMLGFFAALSEVVSPDALKKAVLGSVPPKTRENNEKAFERGREYGLEIIKGRARQDKERPPA